MRTRRLVAAVVVALAGCTVLAVGPGAEAAVVFSRGCVFAPVNHTFSPTLGPLFGNGNQSISWSGACAQLYTADSFPVSVVGGGGGLGSHSYFGDCVAAVYFSGGFPYGAMIGGALSVMAAPEDVGAIEFEHVMIPNFPCVESSAVGVSTGAHVIAAL